MAEDDPRLTAEAEKYTLKQLTNVLDGQGRSRVLGQIRLTHIRFLAGEPEQASGDGDHALDAVEHIASAMIRTRLRELLAVSEPFASVPRRGGVPRPVAYSITGLN